MLIKTNTSSAAGGTAPRTPHQESTTSGNPLSIFLDPPLEYMVAFQWHFGSQPFMMFVTTLHGGCEVVVHIMKFCPTSKC